MGENARRKIETETANNWVTCSVQTENEVVQEQRVENAGTKSGMSSNRKQQNGNQTREEPEMKRKRR